VIQSIHLHVHIHVHILVIKGIRKR
jgi:hypothetical protein